MISICEVKELAKEQRCITHRPRLRGEMQTHVTAETVKIKLKKYRRNLKKLNL